MTVATLLNKVDTYHPIIYGVLNNRTLRPN